VRLGEWLAFGVLGFVLDESRHGRVGKELEGPEIWGSRDGGCRGDTRTFVFDDISLPANELIVDVCGELLELLPGEPGELLASSRP
jgi:hypothetical protein